MRPKGCLESANLPCASVARQVDESDPPEFLSLQPSQTLPSRPCTRLLLESGTGKGLTCEKPMLLPSTCSKRGGCQSGGLLLASKLL